MAFRFRPSDFTLGSEVRDHLELRAACLFIYVDLTQRHRLEPRSSLLHYVDS
jgi:hypothetical protein